jgi:hypothetical protein
MRQSMIAGALCAGASGIGMIMGSGTFFGVLVGLGALYCCVSTILYMMTKAD